MHRSALLLVAALMLACDPDETDPRVQEIWRIDLVSYGAEVDDALLMLGLTRPEIEDRLIDWLEYYYDGLPIYFERGPVEQTPYKSGICLRAATDGTYGWGVLDEGNHHAEHLIGEGDNVSYGVYIDQVAETFDQQAYGLGLTHDQVADEFARLLGVVVAHEIAHGLGLVHTGPEYGLGDIMRPPFLALSIDYAFNPDQYELLRANIVH